MLTIAAILVIVADRFAQAVPDQTKIHLRIVKDTKAEFRANGTWSSIDNSTPPDGFVADSMLVLGTNWKFKIAETIKDWGCLRICGNPNKAVFGAHEVVIGIEGEHINGPHDTGPKKDIDPNWLIRRLSSENQAGTTKWNLGFGEKPAQVTVEWRRPHHVTGGQRHTDVYGVRHRAAAHKGPPNSISGAVQVSAQHVEDEIDPFKPDLNPPHVNWGLCMGGSPGSGAELSYDAAVNQLRLHFGGINILNRTGLLAAGIDPRYATDPILSTSFGDIVLNYLGSTPNGAFQFGPGHILLLDPEEDLAFESGFSGLLVHNTQPAAATDSYAMLDTLVSVEQGECHSDFLTDFGTVNVLRDTLDTAERLEVLGVSLTFTTAVNLADLTANFTASAMHVPATIVVVGAKPVPSVTGVAPGQATGAELSRSYPNPFADHTTIHYRVAEPTPVKIEVYDAAGRVVKRLVNLASQVAGDHSITWDGRGDGGARVSAGVYLYRVTLGDRTWTNTLVLVR